MRKAQIKFYVTLEVEEGLIFPEEETGPGDVSPYRQLQDEVIDFLETLCEGWNGKIKDIEWK